MHQDINMASMTTDPDVALGPWWQHGQLTSAWPQVAAQFTDNNMVPCSGTDHWHPQGHGPHISTWLPATSGPQTTHINMGLGSSMAHRCSLFLSIQISIVWELLIEKPVPPSSKKHLLWYLDLSPLTRFMSQLQTLFCSIAQCSYSLFIDFKQV